MSSLPAGLLLFDIYIRFSRGEKYLWLGEDVRIFQRTILSAVVAAELYAGTNSQQEKRALDELCKAHHALGHFSSPPGSAWIDTGILLRRSRSTFGQMDFVGHFRDLLIASEAMRTGGHYGDREFPRFRAVEVASCVSQEDAETIQPLLTRAINLEAAESCSCASRA
jgi:predicted nucleic acid-binding protein